MLIETLGGGGAERVATDFARHLAQHGEAVTVAVPRMPAGWRVDPACASIRRQVDELDACGVKVVAWHRSGKLAIWQWRPLLSLLRTRHVDVLHAHKLGSALWAILFGRVLGVGAIVVHDHGASAWTERQRNLLYRYFVGRFASRVIVVSDPDAALMVHERGVPSSKVRIVVNGIDSVQPRGTDIRAELGIPPAAPLVTCVAMLRPEKGLDTFIAAIARLVESQPSLAAVIAGGPSVTHPHEPQRLRELVSRFNLEHTVRLVGTRTDVADIVKASNVVVNSSDYEGTPIAILEYMDSARPIVATAVGGTPHVLRDGKDAVLVPPRDPARLATAIGRLLDDNAYGTALAHSALERRRERYTLDRATETLREVYAEVT